MLVVVVEGLKLAGDSAIPQRHLKTLIGVCSLVSVTMTIDHTVTYAVSVVVMNHHRVRRAGERGNHPPRKPTSHLELREKTH